MKAEKINKNIFTSLLSCTLIAWCMKKSFISISGIFPFCQTPVIVDVYWTDIVIIHYLSHEKLTQAKMACRLTSCFQRIWWDWIVDSQNIKFSLWFDPWISLQSEKYPYGSHQETHICKHIFKSVSISVRREKWSNGNVKIKCKHISHWRENVPERTQA